MFGDDELLSVYCRCAHPTAIAAWRTEGSCWVICRTRLSHRDVRKQPCISTAVLRRKKSNPIDSSSDRAREDAICNGIVLDEALELAAGAGLWTSSPNGVGGGS